ncbi:LamG-like jellyroll fold domain-containing protein [Rhodanobacter sp. 115]|uniref:glycosyl hydrolase 2 galactose-binding domain-containing protein n=1 Tax=Rhodanobacter sp. FW021-MT20 TaxID=1162282 RepID=UPI001ED964FA|nr:LamG-like jellyroll fold domain-containing protein [Rhodanobacter sp. 115]
MAVAAVMALPRIARADSVSGPWNVTVPSGGVGFSHSMPAGAGMLDANADWTVYAWVRPRALPVGRQLVAGLGDTDGVARYFMLDGGHLGFWWGDAHEIVTKSVLRANAWQFIAAVERGGRLQLYVNATQVASVPAQGGVVNPVLQIGPVQQPWPNAEHFGGEVAAFTVVDHAENASELKQVSNGTSPTTLTRYELAGGHWPLQTHQMAGQVVPQPPSTLPRSRAPYSAPHARRPGAHPPLAQSGADTWVLGDWYLASATKLDSPDGDKLSLPTYTPGAKPWMLATVPGTVLTTLVDRGVYPDPAYGLNNMAIPESLHEHDWWYRTTFDLPASFDGKQLQLTFDGVNYAAEVWVNGSRVGDIRGAFIRGKFDVTKLLKPGQRNAIAVRVAPPPHPGVAQEESLTAGPGPNGGEEALDGPTFIASEGWDWIPSIRDRNMGLWQPVTLHATGAVRLGAPRIVSHIPVPDLTRADVDIDVPLTNPTQRSVRGTLELSFGEVHISRSVDVPPGGTVVSLTPANTPQLALHNPHLWWPNGYGDPYLYKLNMSFEVGDEVSDTRALHFGIRQVSYELSLFNSAGDLDRVLVTPDLKQHHADRVVNVDYRSIHPTQKPHIWAYSLMPGMEHSPAVAALQPSSLSPYLVLRVNGVRIAAKGGSWGTDDFMKRVSRERLEPYFKLQRDAHLNIIRNWVGQSTEPAFYQLADKYGLLIINEFWESTQDYNMEPMDDSLFLRNAADVIRRYQSHPSIVLWFGRNEGVPQPLLNEKLAKLTAELDGTRLYLPSSNDINLWVSGPYNYQPPQDYFTKLSKGFAVEVGTPSFPTARAFSAMMPKADQWPMSDDWAYHDWHPSGNGDVHGFMVAMAEKFGHPTSLADFERKAQMMNYVNYRALFEGFNAHLWTENSGRMLWMSQPAWPDTMWSIYSHDYDTQASYYGVMEAAQPMHVQMDLPTRQITVINNTRDALKGGHVQVTVYGPKSQVLTDTSCQVTAAAGSVVHACPRLELSAQVRREGMVFVELVLRSSSGEELSRNFYWTGTKPGSLRTLNALPQVKLELSAVRERGGQVDVSLANPSSSMALNTKLTLVDAQGHRVLPVYYSDNYLSIPPGGSRRIEIDVDPQVPLNGAVVYLHGWNAVSVHEKVSAPRRRR